MKSVVMWLYVVIARVIGELLAALVLLASTWRSIMLQCIWSLCITVTTVFEVFIAAAFHFSLKRLIFSCGPSWDEITNVQNVWFQIDHVVLGRGRPGGLWHRLDPCVATLSPARWMALPQRETIPGARLDQRAPVRAVAAYYERYVNQTGIQVSYCMYVGVDRVKDRSNREGAEMIHKNTKRRAMWR